MWRFAGVLDVRLLLNALVEPVCWIILGVIIIYALVTSMTLLGFLQTLSVFWFGFLH